MGKRLAAIFLTMMLGVEMCGTVYAEDFSADVLVEEDIMTEQSEEEIPDIEQEDLCGEDVSDIAEEGEPSISDGSEPSENETVADLKSEADVFSVGEEEDGVYSFYIASEPTKSRYDYGTVRSADDFDLTGMAINIRYTDQTEELLYFTRNEKIEEDSRGNKFKASIVFTEEDGGENGAVGVYEVIIIYYGSDAEAYTELTIAIPADTPRLAAQGNGVFSSPTVAPDTYIKFVPEETGRYMITRSYTENSEKKTVRESIYDKKMWEVSTSDDSMKSVRLIKGFNYYLKPFDKKSTVIAEFVWPVQSVELEGQFVPTVFHTPADFGEGNKNQYTIEKTPWRTQKLKITYTNGDTESMDLYGHSRYGESINAYINYTGNQSAPEAGKYDVHFKLDRSGAEAVLKDGVQVKKVAQKISKAAITIGRLSYTGSYVKPSVTVKSGNKTLHQGTDYTISYNKASRVGAAVKITVTGKGFYTGKATKSAYIVPAKPVLSSVKAGKRSMTVTYRKTTGASGYQIAYSTNQKSGYKYINLNNKVSKKTISNLKSGKKYFVRVRAYRSINGKKYYGDYSSIKTVVVK